MLYLYLASLVLGGVVLAISAFGSSGDGDLGHGEVGHTTDAANAADVAEGISTLFATVRSLRFWTFGLASFGALGLLLDGLNLLPGPVFPFLVSLPVAFAIGWLVTLAFAALRKTSRSSGADVRDYIGKPVDVLLRVASNEDGKVRVHVKGSTIDLVATTDEVKPVAIGESAVIVNIEGTRARIARAARR